MAHNLLIATIYILPAMRPTSIESVLPPHSIAQHSMSIASGTIERWAPEVSLFHTTVATVVLDLFCSARRPSDVRHNVTRDVRVFFVT